MPQLSLLLDARNVDDASIDDPLTFVRVAVPDGSRSAEKRLALPGVPVQLTFSDGPSGSPLALRVSPSRYRDAQIFADVDGDGRVTPKAPITLPRRPGEWLPVFTQWANLTTDFGDLQEALTASDTFRLGRHSAPEQLIGDRYDAVDPQDESRALAKLSLLNLYARLREEPIPGSGMPWFSTIERLIVATRERFMAIVSEDCFDAVHQLSKKGKSGYHHSNPGPHKKNFTELAGAGDVKKHASVKTDVKKANLQFTVAEGRIGEARVFLLDADIDENGNFLLHSFDLIKHFFNGGTHPLDIHEAFREQFPGLDLGYGVEPKRRVEVAAARETSVAMTAVPAVAAAAVDTGAMKAPAAIVVLGDSVPWGQGLLNAEKMHMLLAAAFSASGPGPGVTMVAHSGAVIGVGATQTRPPADPEVPKAHPTILQQCAAVPEAQAAGAELVIVNGGINDVDVRFILNPFTDPADLEDTTARACGPDLLELLRLAASRFPKARIAVLEYYTILSPLSRFTWGLEFLTATGAPPPLALFSVSEGLSFSIWDRIIENCRIFYATSTASIRATVALANAEHPGRFVAIDPGFKDEHAALAPSAWLFGVNWNLSPQDPVAPQRRHLCIRDEADLFRREGCFRASAGHPNPLGAQAYARALAMSLSPPVN